MKANVCVCVYNMVTRCLICDLKIYGIFLLHSSSKEGSMKKLLQRDRNMPSLFKPPTWPLYINFVFYILYMYIHFAFIFFNWKPNILVFTHIHLEDVQRSPVWNYFLLSFRMLYNWYFSNYRKLMGSFGVLIPTSCIILLWDLVFVFDGGYWPKRGYIKKKKINGCFRPKVTFVFIIVTTRCPTLKYTKWSCNSFICPFP